MIYCVLNSKEQTTCRIVVDLLLSSCIPTIVDFIHNCMIDNYNPCPTGCGLPSERILNTYMLL